MNLRLILRLILGLMLRPAPVRLLEPAVVMREADRARAAA